MKIAFVGEQCSGKTSALQIAVNHFSGRQVKFIDKLYQINNVLGVNKNRGFMQQMGDLVRSYFGEDFFANDFVNKFQNLQNENIFCDDARTILEFESIQKAGFTIFYIDASREIRKQRADMLGLEFIENHPVELNIASFKDRCHFIIDNNHNSIEKLKQQILTTRKP
jgi:hypothetical protein